MRTPRFLFAALVFFLLASGSAFGDDEPVPAFNPLGDMAAYTSVSHSENTWLDFEVPMNEGFKTLSGKGEVWYLNYSGDDLADRPVFMIGGEKRLSSRIALVTENWIVPGTNPLVSGGLRFFGRKMSVDFGLINMLGKDAVSPGVPYIDFVFKF